MDIVRKIKPLRARFHKLSLKQKSLLLTVLISLLSIIIPHTTQAVIIEPKVDKNLVFQIGNYAIYLSQLNQKLTNDYRVAQINKEIERKKKLSLELKYYLASFDSPLSEHTDTLVKQVNWIKLVALANAESSLCRKFPTDTNNCWGIGGANLWHLGNNLDEAIVAANRFLLTHPKSGKKYSQMSFEQMNGLYKQPATDNWVANNLAIQNDLKTLEQNLWFFFISSLCRVGLLSAH